ncbi:MAG: ATP-dependent serine peptidase containing a PDZ domain protein [Leifsonia xyli]|nr:MAG: ATP-dependent serine peptidase containing a PDZ domain protein [Leifsonia xyli]
MRTAPEGDRESRRRLVGQGLVLLAVLATLLVGISPTPYAVERPGPVYDTLGTTLRDRQEVPVIAIDGATTYPTDGRLDLLTVYLDGSRENPLDWFQVIGAWFDPTRAILPLDAVFPMGETEDEADEQSAVDMQQSQQSAVAAALSQLEISYDSTVGVGLVSPDGPSNGVLQEGDELLTVGGVAVTTESELRAAIADAGVGSALELGIRRDGTPQTVTVTTAARSASDDRPVIGIAPTESYQFPFQVDINLQDVGGPSAGMMFALGIYDLLTPGALTGGAHIAGTGTIDAAGEVGRIGGIRQKMFGARDAGAEWFLAPAGNCDEVVGHIPDGLQVFSVATLDDAIAVTRAIGTGASTEGFARCR